MKPDVSLVFPLFQVSPPDLHLGAGLAILHKFPLMISRG